MFCFQGRNIYDESQCAFSGLLSTRAGEGWTPARRLSQARALGACPVPPSDGACRGRGLRKTYCSP